MFDLKLFLKGVTMGAADIVPGVSGGTIAFISGIYFRLLAAIKGFLPALWQARSHLSWQRFCRESDLIFLLTLFAGILLSVVSLSNVITYLLHAHPIPLWSFFFGLILASVRLVAREYRFFQFKNVLVLLIGGMLAVLISRLSPAQLEPSMWVAFGSGALAICAMILPGISGSFILVMLGTYGFILSALKNFEWFTLGLFAAGCVLGLLSMANVLHWALKRYHETALALLCGFMIGALDKVWPWKQVLSYRENRHGELVPLQEVNVSPWYFTELNGDDHQLLLAVIFAVIAAVVVLGLDFVANRKQVSE